ncbi:MAG: RIP metalloprotease RseP [Saprospiraceae bacterium]
MDYVIMGGQLMLSLSILIVLHEMGHFFPARWFNTRVEKFYLFFDPWFELFKYKRGDTEYGIGWLPLGGYVKISGMIDESFDSEQLAQEPQPWEFRSKPAWQRLIIMLGGVTVNFILGFFLYGMVLWGWGEQYLPADKVQYGIYADSLGKEIGFQTGDKVLSVNGQPFEKFSDRVVVREIIVNDAKEVKVERGGNEVPIKIDEKWVTELSSYDNKGRGLFEARFPFEIVQVVDGTPAEKAGLQAGDKIVGVNGKETPFINEPIRIIAKSKEKPVQLTVERNGQRTPITVTPSETGKIGIQFKGPQDFFGTETDEYTLAEALPEGVKQGWGFLTDQVKAFGQIFAGKIKPQDSLGGFGSIGSMFGNEWQWERFWKMTAILSLILAFMNLLPIPALDGGHVMFLLYEMVTGRKPSDKFLEVATMIGFVIVLGLVLFANGADIYRAIFK